MCFLQGSFSPSMACSYGLIILTIMNYFIDEISHNSFLIFLWVAAHGLFKDKG